MLNAYQTSRPFYSLFKEPLLDDDYAEPQNVWNAFNITSVHVMHYYWPKFFKILRTTASYYSL